MPNVQGGPWTPNSQIISPGVFVSQTDQSGVAAGVQNIGGAVVAPFPAGPAFSPMLFTDVPTLQKTFGIPDGVYYGPYTATQYLQEQGTVTVTRVGPLTGYEQKYPFIIWAQKGSWNRSGSIGNLVPANSFVYLSGSLSNGYSGSVSFNGNKMTANSASFTVAFQPGIGDDINFSTSSLSGSYLYYGQTLTLGLTNFSATASVSSTSSLSASIATGSFSASIANGTPLTFIGGPDDFDLVSIYSGSINTILGLCNTPVLGLTGILSGSFGQYNGGFTATNLTFNPCTNPGSWVTGSDVRVLAVLADTQAGGIEDLVAPGFSGSFISSSKTFPNNSIGTTFNLTLQNSNASTPYGVYQFSLDESDPHYITNVFGTDPTVGNPATQVAGQKIEAAYLYNVFQNAIAEVVANYGGSANDGWNVYGSVTNGTTITGEPLNFTDQYSNNVTAGDSQFSITNANTPWVFSQKIAPWQPGGNPTRFRLFQVATLSDGTNTNTSYKIEISNVKLAGTVPGSNWGTFTLSVRNFSDTDKKPSYLEVFNNLTLDPTSANYVARAIGDQYNFINFDGKIVEFGNYTNNSNYIRIVMNDSPYPETAVPYGFEAFVTPINSSMGYWTPTMKYTMASIYSLNPGKYPSGITFNDAPAGADAELLSLYPTTSFGNGAADDNLQYFAPIPVFGAYNSIGRNIEFALDDDYSLYGVTNGNYPAFATSSAIPAILDHVNEPTYVKMRKFVFGFQGGFDGQSPAIDIEVGDNLSSGNTQGLDCTLSTSPGSVAYAQCINTLRNADQFDINLIVTPGIISQLHPYVTNLVVDMCEGRGDCFYIMDMYLDEGNPTTSQITEVINLAGGYDTSYAATYYPWVKILDTNINQIVTVPPSVVLPAVYASNDKVSAEWFAPAGLNRGGITTAVGLTDRCTHQERDDLYQGKVNPIASFPGSGIVVWGQKTLLNADSALNRVNIQRLLINLKKFFSSISQFLIFEQNQASTWNRFLSIVSPYMESVQQRSGLYAFYVQMDSSNNTPDLIDENVLVGNVYIKPTKVSEFIVIPFTILSTGATFPTS